MKKLTLLILLFLFVFSFRANAQKGYGFGDAWYLSGGAGTTVFLGDVAPVPEFTLKSNTNEYGFAYMFRLGKRVIPAFDMNFEYMKGTCSGTKLSDAAGSIYDRHFSGDSYAWTINARINPLKLFNETWNSPLSFFGRIGIGGIYYRALLTQNSTGNLLAIRGYSDDGLTKQKREQATVVPYGFGLCYDFSDNFRLEVALDLYNAYTDQLDAKIGRTNYLDKYAVLSGSLVYGFDWDRWAAPKFSHDADFDKVRNRKDICPSTPGGVKVDETGCPVDSDKDGVADYLDKCPDQSGVAAFEGCPDKDGDGFRDADDQCPEVAGLAAFAGCPDSDGDGLPDKDDQCPDLAGPVQLNGCPDRDGDAVMDSEDRCPDQPGSLALRGCPDKDSDGVADIDDLCPDVAGIKENKGCPEVKPETIAIFRQALTGIKFETGKEKIKPESYPILDQVVKVMKENPAYKLEINGHTDNTGDSKGNQLLSQFRANAVKWYLENKGIDSKRMIATGYGDSQPKADNNTPAGRAENRRVEFKVNF